MLDRENLDAIAEILRSHPQVWIYAEKSFAAGVHGRVRFARHASRDARAHDHQRQYVEDLGDDRLADRLRRQSRTRAVFTRWITNTDSCASQISQSAAVEAITGPQDAADAMRASFLERRDLIVGC